MGNFLSKTKTFFNRHGLFFLVALILYIHYRKYMNYLGGVDLFHPFPIVNTDFIVYYAWIARAHQFLDLAGRLWGYDPFMGAGHVSGAILGIGTHFFTYLTYYLRPWITLEVTLLWIEYLTLFFSPFLIIPTVKNFGGTWRNSWVAFAIVTFMYGNFTPESGTVMGGSLYAFQLSCFLGLLQLSFYWRWTKGPKPRYFKDQPFGVWGAFTLLSIILFQIHPGALLFILGPSLIIFFAQSLKRGSWHLGMLFLTVALVGIFNWYWIRPYLEFGNWKWTVPYQLGLGWKGLFKTFFWYNESITGTMWALVHLFFLKTTVDALKIEFKNSRYSGIFWLSFIIPLFLISYFGTAIPWIISLQPGRYIIPLFLGIFVLVSLHISTSWSSKNIRGGLLLFMMVVFFFWPTYGVFRINSGLYVLLNNKKLDFINELEAAINSWPPSPGRILLENRDSVLPHFPGYLPYATGKAFIGEFAPSSHIKTNFSSFSTRIGYSNTPWAFSKPINFLNEKELGEYFEIYNIWRVAVLSNEMANFLIQFPTLLKFSEMAGIHKIFEIHQKSSWLLEGTGRVEFDLDQIRVSEASRGPLVLKFHWLKTLKTKPHVVMRPIFIKDDPLPFIELQNTAGYDTILIYNAGL